ncbi:MAG: glycosyltransferase family 4 protein [Desulfobacteraceae bacterium]|nr:glycosyltransferase family 4 protein [Desulfobacteraceae bacterium]
MKVLNLMKTSVGGAWALRQMKELVRLGVEVHAVLPDRGPLYAAYVESGIQVHLLAADFPLLKPWLLATRLKTLRNLVVDLQPDIVHSHFVGTTLSMRLALRRDPYLPRIFQVPGPLHLEQALFRWGEIATARSNDFWIGTCSATRRRYLQSGIPAQRLFLCFYGTYPELFLQREVKGKLRAELGLAEDIPIVGMVAFMYKPKRIMGKRRGVKGHEDLIDAVALAALKVPELNVVFVGGAWGCAHDYEKTIRRYADERIPGRAHFLGTRNDVAALYADFDLAVHPSHSENLGGAGESLLMGIPTIASDVGGFPDIVIPGKTGWLVPPEKPALLADAIVRALSHRDEGRRLAANGREWVKEHCDVRRTARQVFDVYQTVLGACVS